MVNVKDIRNFFKSPKASDAPALVGSASHVSYAELLIIENEIKKSMQVRKH